MSCWDFFEIMTKKSQHSTGACRRIFIVNNNLFLSPLLPVKLASSKYHDNTFLALCTDLLHLLVSWGFTSMLQKRHTIKLTLRRRWTSYFHCYCFHYSRARNVLDVECRAMMIDACKRRSRIENPFKKTVCLEKYVASSVNPAPGAVLLIIHFHSSLRFFLVKGSV